MTYLEASYLKDQIIRAESYYKKKSEIKDIPITGLFFY